MRKKSGIRKIFSDEDIVEFFKSLSEEERKDLNIRAGKIIDKVIEKWKEFEREEFEKRY